MNTDRPTPSPVDELREIVVEALDDYHDGGEFHEYTPLEKQRHADALLAKITEAYEKGRQDERTAQ